MEDRSGAPAPVRYLDLVLLALALPVFALASLPLLGFAVAAAAWLVQRALFALGARRARSALAAGERRVAMGYTAGSALGRVWLVALAILLVGGLGAREDGLAAAVLTLALVTTFLASQALERLLAPEGS